MESDAVKVTITRAFTAPAERVFDAWLDPAQLGQWMFGPRIRAEVIVHLRLDPQVGGKFSFLVLRQGVEIDHVGKYLEIDRPRKLVFTWGIAGESVGDSSVTIEIQQQDAGCELTLVHAMDPRWADYADRARVGWTKMLQALSDSLGV